MKSFKCRIGLVSLTLMLPAMLLCVSGLLYVAFGMDGVNHLLDVIMANVIGRALLSPVVALGGPIVAFVLNAGQVFHVSADVLNEEFVVALSVKRMFGHLLRLTLAVGLILLLAAYAFVENFQVVAR